MTKQDGYFYRQLVDPLGGPPIINVIIFFLQQASLTTTQATKRF